MVIRLILLLCCLGIGFPAAAADCEPLPEGPSQFAFSGWSGPTLPVFVHRPPAAAAPSRIVFVMHGVLRDGDRYRDEWRALADAHNLLIVVPTFGLADFPTTGSYNLGNIVAASGGINPRSQWSFSVLEPLFDDIVCRVAGSQRGYALYGHSAGGQFVHRYVAFADAPRLDVAVAANSGWYSMPNSEPFPYGWGGEVAGLVMPASAFARPLTILLGTQDTDRNDPNLRISELADRQGLTRYARGLSFFAAAREMAAAEGSFGWTLAFAPGIGHDNAGMAPFAIPHLLGSGTATP